MAHGWPPPCSQALEYIALPAEVPVGAVEDPMYTNQRVELRGARFRIRTGDKTCRIARVHANVRDAARRFVARRIGPPHGLRVPVAIDRISDPEA